MAKFFKATTFTAISDQLIIEACENGSGHVGRWRTIVANRVKAQATMTAPEGDETNHYDHWRGYTPGCYKNGFKVERYGGGTRHIRRARIRNDCPHALFVEMGRYPSNGSESFTSRRSVLGALFGGNPKGKKAFLIHSKNGTIGFVARPVLRSALKTVAETTNTFDLRIRNLSVTASYYRLLDAEG